MGRDLQFQSQESAGATSKYRLLQTKGNLQLLHSGVQSNDLVYNIQYISYEVLCKKQKQTNKQSKKKRNKNILSSLQTVTLKMCGTFYLPGKKKLVRLLQTGLQKVMVSLPL